MIKDKEVADIIAAEEYRQKHTLRMVASTNEVSDDILESLGSVFTNDYAEGYPGKR